MTPLLFLTQHLRAITRSGGQVAAGEGLVTVGRLVGATVAGAVVGATVAGAVVVGLTGVGATVVGGVVGLSVVGGSVVGVPVVGGSVVGLSVVGVSVVGATVVGLTVVGLTVVGATEVGATVVGLPAAGLVVATPGAVTPGAVVLPGAGGFTSALRIGGSAPGCFAGWPIALGLAFPLAWAPAGEPSGSTAAAGQLAALQAMNPLLDVVVWDALVPYQQMTAIAPITPVPMMRFRIERGRSKSSSFGRCRSNDFPPLVITVSYCLRAFAFLSRET
jgi:hypothetical protein